MTNWDALVNEIIHCKRFETKASYDYSWCQESVDNCRYTTWQAVLFLMADIDIGFKSKFGTVYHSGERARKGKSWQG